MRVLLAVSVVAVGIQCLTVAARASTSDVFQLDAFLQGTVQSGTTNHPVNSTVRIITADLINFGLGRPLGSEIEKNRRLAIASDCANNTLRVVVYNLEDPNNPITLGEVQPVLEIAGFKKKELTRHVIGDLQIVPTGNETNGLIGGTLKLSAAISAKTNDCFLRLTGKMLGTLVVGFPVVLTNFPCTNFVSCSLTNEEFCVTNCVTDGTLEISNATTNYAVAISKATLQSKGKKLGTTIQAEP